MFDEIWREKVINEGVKKFEKEWKNEELFKITMKEYSCLERLVDCFADYVIWKKIAETFEKIRQFAESIKPETDLDQLAGKRQLQHHRTLEMYQQAAFNLHKDVENASSLFHTHFSKTLVQGDDMMMSPKFSKKQSPLENRIISSQLSADVQKVTQLLSQLINSIIEFPNGFLTESPNEKSNQNRSLELAKLRKMNIPLLTFLLNKVYFWAKRSHKSLQTSWQIVDENNRLYQDFDQEEMLELLILLRENVLQILNDDKGASLIDE